MTTPTPAEAPAADRTPTDPDVLYAAAQRVRTLEAARDQVGELMQDAQNRFDEVAEELREARSELSKLLRDVDIDRTDAWKQS